MELPYGWVNSIFNSPTHAIRKEPNNVNIGNLAELLSQGCKGVDYSHRATASNE